MGRLYVVLVTWTLLCGLLSEAVRVRNTRTAATAATDELGGSDPFITGPLDMWVKGAEGRDAPDHLSGQESPVVLNMEIPHKHRFRRQRQRRTRRPSPLALMAKLNACCNSVRQAGLKVLQQEAYDNLAASVRSYILLPASHMVGALRQGMDSAVSTGATYAEVLYAKAKLAMQEDPKNGPSKEVLNDAFEFGQYGFHECEKLYSGPRMQACGAHPVPAPTPAPPGLFKRLFGSNTRRNNNNYGNRRSQTQVAYNSGGRQQRRNGGGRRQRGRRQRGRGQRRQRGGRRNRQRNYNNMA